MTEEQKQRQLIEPGLYFDLSNDDYHSSNGVSSSQLKNWLVHAPNEVLFNQMEESQSTEDKDAGSLHHLLVLEPEKAESSYVILPKFNRRSKAGKVEAEAWEKENQGKLWVTKENLERSKIMAESVLSHPEASLLIKDTIKESSIYWWYKNNKDDMDERDYKQIVKVRPDAICKSYPMLLDLKTSADASYDEFQKTILKWYYHLSAAMYLDGVNQCEQLRDYVSSWRYVYFVFIVTSKLPAWDVDKKKNTYNTAVYSLTPDSIDMGNVLYRYAMQRLHDGKKDQYPGLPSGIIDIDLPPWGKKIPRI